MSSLVPISASLTPQQLNLVRSTVAADCNSQEFDLFIEVAKQLKLNPFRRQIYAVVYSKDTERRKMSIIVGIDGYRSVANDSGDYRPSEDEPEFTYDDALKSSANPLGLVKASVRVFKYGPDKQWYPVSGVAYWSEFAPIEDAAPDDAYEWIDSDQKFPPGHKKAGQFKRKKVLKQGREADAIARPAGKWLTMPLLMLAKCAEAQALRKGWPSLSGVYIAEEMARADLEDLSASEQAEAARVEQRLERIAGKDTILVQWQGDQPLQAVPIGKFADMVLGRLTLAADVAEARAFLDTNQRSMQEFWARSPSDGLQLKKEIEAELEKMAREEGQQQGAAQ